MIFVNCMSWVVVLANPKSQILASQLLLTRMFLGFYEKFRNPRFYILPGLCVKSLHCEGTSLLVESGIWRIVCGHPTISRETWLWQPNHFPWALKKRKGLWTNFSTLEVGYLKSRSPSENVRMNRKLLTFSWLQSLMIFSSLNVRFVNTRCSNALSIFLMATRLSSSWDFLSFAPMTSP